MSRLSELSSVAAFRFATIYFNAPSQAIKIGVESSTSLNHVHIIPRMGYFVNPVRGILI